MSPPGARGGTSGCGLRDRYEKRYGRGGRKLLRTALPHHVPRRPQVVKLDERKAARLLRAALACQANLLDVRQGFEGVLRQARWGRNTTATNDTWSEAGVTAETAVEESDPRRSDQAAAAATRGRDGSEEADGGREEHDAEGRSAIVDLR